MPRAGISSRSLLPSRSYTGTQTASDFSLAFNLLLSLTTVLSDTFSTSSCLKEHLTSKDSFTHWHPCSRQRIVIGQRIRGLKRHGRGLARALFHLLWSYAGT